jgi:hypothetical protein
MPRTIIRAFLILLFVCVSIGVGAQQMPCPRSVNARFSSLSVYEGDKPLITQARIRNSKGEIIRELETNEHGEAQFGELPEGEYLLSSGESSPAQFTECFRATVGSEQCWIDIDLVSRELRGNAIVVANIDGVVMDRSGAVIPSTRVTLTKLISRAIVAEGSTAYDGRFSLKSPDGLYELKLVAPEFAPHILYVDLKRNSKVSKQAMEIRMSYRHHLTIIEVTASSGKY